MVSRLARIRFHRPVFRLSSIPQSTSTLTRRTSGKRSLRNACMLAAEGRSICNRRGRRNNCDTLVRILRRK